VRAQLPSLPGQVLRQSSKLWTQRTTNKFAGSRQSAANISFSRALAAATMARIVCCLPCSKSSNYREQLSQQCTCLFSLMRVQSSASLSQLNTEFRVIMVSRSFSDCPPNMPPCSQRSVPFRPRATACRTRLSMNFPLSHRKACLPGTKGQGAFIKYTADCFFTVPRNYSPVVHSPSAREAQTVEGKLIHNSWRLPRYRLQACLRHA